MLGLSMTAYRRKDLGNFERWVEEVKGAGFDFVEVVSEWPPHYLTRETAKLFGEVVDSYKMELTVHAPFSDLNVASFNERVREISLQIIRETLELAAKIGGANPVTVHPGHCSPHSVRNREKYLEIHRESLGGKMARWSEEYGGVRVGVENMPSFPILDAQTCERLRELVEGGIGIGVTFDVGHLNTTTGNFGRFLEVFKGRIVHVHLHDNHGERDEHGAPGEGTVPWGGRCSQNFRR